MKDIDIGVGFDRLTKQQRNQAVIASPDKINKGSTNVSNNVTATIYYSNYDMSRSFDGSLTVTVSNPQAQVSASGEYKSSQKISAYDFFYVLRAKETVKEDKLYTPYAFIKPTVFKETIFQNQHGYEEFRNQYGDSFVNSIIYGRELVVIIHFKSNSREQQKEITGKLNLEIPSAQTKVGASVATTLDEVFKNVEYNVTVYSAGLKSAQITTPEPKGIEILTFLNQLTSENNKMGIEPAKVHYTVTPYSAIGVNAEPNFDVKKHFKNYHQLLEGAEALYSKIIKLSEAATAARACFYSPPDGNLLSKEEVERFHSYREQSKKLAKLEKLSNELESYKKALADNPFSKELQEKYKFLVDKGITLLSKIFNFIKKGGTQQTILRWVPADHIKRVNHAKKQQYFFNLAIPTDTDKLKFEMDPPQVINDPTACSVDLRAITYDGKRCLKTTVCKEIVDGTEVDMSKEDKPVALGLVPLLRKAKDGVHNVVYGNQGNAANKLSKNSQFYFRPTSKKCLADGHAKAGVLISAIHFFGRPEKVLIPDRVDLPIYKEQSGAVLNYTDNDLSVFMRALVADNTRNTDERKYLLPRTGESGKKILHYVVLPPIKYIDDLSAYIENGNAKIDMLGEILPHMDKYPNCAFKVVFPFMLSPIGYKWVAAEVLISKTTTKSQVPDENLDIRNFTLGVRLHIPNCGKGDAEPPVTDEIFEAFRTALAKRLTAPKTFFVKEDLEKITFMHAGQTSVDDTLNITAAMNNIINLVSDEPLVRVEAINSNAIKIGLFEMVAKTLAIGRYDASTINFLKNYGTVPARPDFSI